MYERILHPTDGSEGSEAAAEHAIELARRYDASLHVVYAVRTDVVPDAGGFGVYDALEEAGQTAVDAAVERAEAAGVETVEGAIERGRPHRVIVQYADEHDVDLVVMGTHGRTGLDHYLLGSVAEKVVRTSPVPVMTVRAPEAAAETGD